MRIRVRALEDCCEGGGFRNMGETFEIDLVDGQKLSASLAAIDPRARLTEKLPPGTMTLGEMDLKPYRDRGIKAHEIPLTHHQD